MGHLLFFDTRLSANNTKSCASCHNPEMAFTDGYRSSITSLGDPVLRNAPSLLNIRNFRYFNWADSSIKTLFSQHARPLYGNKPVELGLHLDSAQIFHKLTKDQRYERILKRLDLTRLNDYWLRTALAEYVGAMESFNSPYDRYVKGNPDALNPIQLRGKALFFSDSAGCSGCHTPPLFTTNNPGSESAPVYFNRMLNPSDSGLFHTTGNHRDLYHFRVPGLRNIALTAPYFHDGSALDLHAVLDYYERHQALNPDFHPKIKWTPADKNALIHFLHSLTDSSIFANSFFKNPFNDQPR